MLNALALTLHEKRPAIIERLVRQEYLRVMGGIK